MRITELRIASRLSAWEALGLVSRPPEDSSSAAVGVIVVPDLTLCFAEIDGASPNLMGWTFAAEASDAPMRPHTTTIDGIATTLTPVRAVPRPDDHRWGIVGVDHIVVMTGSLERTSSAITETIGAPLRRTRDAGHGVRQGFHTAGGVILEVVERPDLRDTVSASLWGLVFTVRDIDDVVGWLGPDVVSAPREAVQPGRRIATIRVEAGLGVPVALMTPHQQR